MLNRMMITNKSKPESLHVVRHEGVIINPIPSQAFLFGRLGMSKFIRKDSIAPFCACGCGQKAEWNKWAKKWNEYIRGHQNKGRISPLRGKDKYADEKARPAPLCACGCKQKTEWNKSEKRWNKFINRHSRKGTDKYTREKKKKPPLCACGCGNITKWGTKKYNKFIHCHHAKGKNHPLYGKFKDNNPNYNQKRPSIAGKNHPLYGKFGKDHPAFGIQFTKEELKARSNRMKNGGAAFANSFIKSPSRPQVELFELIKLIYPNAILNYPSLNLSIDIAIPNRKIAVEYDGSYWHRDKEADKIRQKKLEAIGWRFLRYIDYIPSINKLKKDLRDVTGKEAVE